MSYNDRCGEAAEVLAHGGVLRGMALDHLVDFLRDSKETCAAPRGLVRAILDAPENRHLVDQCWDGEWQGPADRTDPTGGAAGGEAGDE